MNPLFRLLQKLDEGKWHYTLTRHRLDSILVSVTFVGERVEIDVFEDGSMEVSRFKGAEDVVGNDEYIMNLLHQKNAEDKI